MEEITNFEEKIPFIDKKSIEDFLNYLNRYEIKPWLAFFKDRESLLVKCPFCKKMTKVDFYLDTSKGKVIFCNSCQHCKSSFSLFANIDTRIVSNIFEKKNLQEKRFSILKIIEEVKEKEQSEISIEKRFEESYCNLNLGVLYKRSRTEKEKSWKVYENAKKIGEKNILELLKLIRRNLGGFLCEETNLKAPDKILKGILSTRGLICCGYLLPLILNRSQFTRLKLLLQENRDLKYLDFYTFLEIIFGRYILLKKKKKESFYRKLAYLIIIGSWIGILDGETLHKLTFLTKNIDDIYDFILISLWLGLKLETTLLLIELYKLAKEDYQRLKDILAEITTYESDIFTSIPIYIEDPFGCKIEHINLSKRIILNIIAEIKEKLHEDLIKLRLKDFINLYDREIIDNFSHDFLVYKKDYLKSIMPKYKEMLFNLEGLKNLIYSIAIKKFSIPIVNKKDIDKFFELVNLTEITKKRGLKLLSSSEDLLTHIIKMNNDLGCTSKRNLSVLLTHSGSVKEHLLFSIMKNNQEIGSLLLIPEVGWHALKKDGKRFSKEEYEEIERKVESFLQEVSDFLIGEGLIEF